MHFDTIRWLKEKFGTPKGVIKFLAAYGVDAPNESTVEKWFQREAVPSQWFALLLAFIEVECGKPQPISRYLVSQ